MEGREQTVELESNMNTLLNNAAATETKHASFESDNTGLSSDATSKNSDRVTDKEEETVELEPHMEAVLDETADGLLRPSIPEDSPSVCESRRRRRSSLSNRRLDGGDIVETHQGNFTAAIGTPNGSQGPQGHRIVAREDCAQVGMFTQHGRCDLIGDVHFPLRTL